MKKLVGALAVVAAYVILWFIQTIWTDLYISGTFYIGVMVVAYGIGYFTIEHFEMLEKQIDEILKTQQI
jgi:hypothetical protein